MIGKIEINLLPEEYRIRKRSIIIPRALVYPAVVFVALLIGMGLETIRLNDDESRLRGDVAAIKKEIEANRHLQADIDRQRASKNATEEKIRGLERISVDREKWVLLLETLSSSLPSYSWLISVREEMGPPVRLAIEARTYSFPEVAHYMSRLEESDYVSGVELVLIEQIQGQGRMMYRYSITCTLDSDAGIRRASAEAAGMGGR